MILILIALCVVQFIVIVEILYSSRRKTIEMAHTIKVFQLKLDEYRIIHTIYQDAINLLDQLDDFLMFDTPIDEKSFPQFEFDEHDIVEYNELSRNITAVLRLIFY